jgi:hypothetical protein
LGAGAVAVFFGQELAVGFISELLLDAYVRIYARDYVISRILQNVPRGARAKELRDLFVDVLRAVDELAVEVEDLVGDAPAAAGDRELRLQLRVKTLVFRAAFFQDTVLRILVDAVRGQGDIRAGLLLVEPGFRLGLFFAKAAFTAVDVALLFRLVILDDAVAVVVEEVARTDCVENAGVRDPLLDPPAQSVVAVLSDNGVGVALAGLGEAAPRIVNVVAVVGRRARARQVTCTVIQESGGRLTVDVLHLDLVGRVGCVVLGRVGRLPVVSR